MQRKLFPLVFLTLALAACDGDRGAVAPPRYPSTPPGTQRNFANPDWEARRSRIQSLMPEVEVMARKAFTSNRLPSLVAGVLVDGRLLWWQGFGTRDLDAGGPVTAHTVYRIGSLTKLVTAMAVLRLRDEGKLPLDTAAVSLVPELGTMSYPTNDSPQITIRHLLTHTSGLARLGGFDYASDRARPVSEREVLEGLRGASLANVPGITTVYSNLGYTLLGIIAGRAAERPYHEYVDEQILAPLEMRATVWREDEVPHDRLATGYAFERGKYHPRHHWKMGASEGAGGLYASLDDLVRLMAFHMTAWPPGARPSSGPLHNATLRESHMLGGHQRPGKGVALGGWMMSTHFGSTVLSHEGETHQYAAALRWIPDKRVGVVAMTNSGRASVLSSLLSGVTGLIAKRLGAVSGGKKMIVR